MPPKLLITGATGLLGSHLLRAAHEFWRPVGTYHRTTRRLDLSDYNETKAMIADVQPAAVIHAAAITDLDYCEKYPDDSLRINLIAATDLAALCSDLDIPFVFTSADLVFDGSNAPYNEDDPPTPINVFGEHRALAEEGILAAYADAVVVRLPLLLGYSSLGRESFYHKLVASFRRGHEVTLFGDAIRTPVSAAVAAQGLLQLAGSGFEDDVNIAEIDRAAGLLHLGGRDQISLYELGLLTLSILGLNEQLAVPISVLDSYAGLLETHFLAARSANVTLDSTLAYELGFDPPPLRTQLEELLPDAWRTPAGAEQDTDSDLNTDEPDQSA